MQRLNFMYKYFNALMSTPCKILKLTEAVKSDGTRAKTYTTDWEGNCNFHSITIQESKFADKVGTKSVYVVCLPINVSVSLTDRVEIDSITYSVIGVREATRIFEQVIEVVKYE